MPQPFAILAERVVEALLESDPVTATRAGDHRYDDRLPDFSHTAIDAQVRMLREAADALASVDIDALPAPERVDQAQLLSAVESRLFELTELREHEWDPLVHNPGALLHALLARPFAPAEERLASVAGRLAALPDALAVARDVLHDCPRIHVQTAIGQFEGVAGLIRGHVPALAAQVPGSAVTPLTAKALDAVEDFVGWLRARAQEPGRDPRLGRRMWEAKLWYTLDTELSASEVLARARANLDRVTEEIAEAAVALVGGPATDATVRAALDRLAAEHPDDATIVDLARVCLAETTAFVAGHDLVSLVDDPCVIEEMPEFNRGIAVAYCDPPGMLETADVPTFFCIAPPPADWPAHRRESFYREYNNHLIRNLTVHEAVPGHFLQLAHARRYRGSSRARALCTSGPFVEGWAVHVEEVMADAGFGGPPMRLHQLKMQLRMTINAIIDQLVHCAEMSEAEALELMTGRGYQEEGEAAGKWRRALLTSTQLSTYFVGYSEVAAIAAARPAGTSARAWHDAMLAHGNPAPRHLRTLLGI